MSRKTLLIQSACCATALAGAFIAGRASSRSSSPGPVTGGAADQASVLSRAGLPPARPGQADSATARQTAAAEAQNRAVMAATPEQAAARLKEIFGNEDPVTRMGDYLAFLKTLKTNEARSAALTGMLENFNPRERGRELHMLMSDWAGTDPQAALSAVKDNKDWTGTMAASTVLSKWVTTNPDAAIAWAVENGREANETENGNPYMVGLLGTLAKSDLDRAATLAQEMGRSRARGQVMDAVLEQYLTRRTPEAAQQWASSLPEGPFKEGLTQRLAARLASRDGPSAAAWASSLPDTQNKPQVLAQVIERWAREQPNEAGAWLNQFPPSTGTDDPRETFAWQVQRRDPEAAIAWASTITDERRRERATRDLIRSWFERDPNQARQWVDNSNVSGRIKQRYGTRTNNG